MNNLGTAIINTECANINSVFFALQNLGDNPIVTDQPIILQQAKRVILPGVGNAKNAMKILQHKKLCSVIQALTCPVLGICLGMQLLAKFSMENNCEMLNIIPESVDHLEQSTGIRLPHMGWNQIQIINSHPIFQAINQYSYFYFVHSYAIKNTASTIAICHHGNHFSASICHNNFIGVQFHPERSGKNGKQLLNNFLNL